MAISTNYIFAKKSVSMLDTGENQGTNCIRALKYWAADTAGDFILLEVKNLLSSTILPMSSSPELLQPLQANQNHSYSLSMFMGFKKFIGGRGDKAAYNSWFDTCWRNMPSTAMREMLGWGRVGWQWRDDVDTACKDYISSYPSAIRNAFKSTVPEELQPSCESISLEDINSWPFSVYQKPPGLTFHTTLACSFDCKLQKVILVHCNCDPKPQFGLLRAIVIQTKKEVNTESLHRHKSIYRSRPS